MTCNTNQICQACSLGCHHEHEIGGDGWAKKNEKCKCRKTKCLIQNPENASNQNTIQKTENEVFNS